MSTDLEERLTSALMSNAASAPPAGDLLAGVHARARQRGRRRFALTASTAAMGLVLAAIGIADLAGRGDGALRPPDVVSHGDEGPVIAGGVPALQFPYTPGWLPPGVAQTPHVSFGESGLEASYRDAKPGPDGDLEGIQLWSSDHDVTYRGDGVTRRSTTYAGRPAILATTDGAISLGWQPTAGTWRVITVFNTWASEDIARRVADGVVERPFDAAPPFTMRLVPRDSELADWTTDGRLVFVPRGQAKQYRTGPEVTGAVQIAVRRRTAALVGHGERVVVQQHDGWLSCARRCTITVELDDRTLLIIETPVWSRDDVLRLADETHYNGGVPPQEG